MGELPDWTIWILAAAVLALFGWFFWHVGASLVTGFVLMVRLIQNWPQLRRERTEAEAQSGGRWPLWYRAARLAVLLALAGLVAYQFWRLVRAA
jgi:hypothetical protein